MVSKKMLSRIKKKCVDCGESKLLYRDFRPRWRGCADHADEKTGRRHFVPDCPDCVLVLVSRTRQPRCRTCDKKRLKRARRAPCAFVPAPGRAPRVKLDKKCAKCGGKLRDHVRVLDGKKAAKSVKTAARRKTA